MAIADAVLTIEEMSEPRKRFEEDERRRKEEEQKEAADAKTPITTSGRHQRVKPKRPYKYGVGELKDLTEKLATSWRLNEEQKAEVRRLANGKGVSEVIAYFHMMAKI